MNRQQKITLGMRASGVRGLLIYCADYKCSHSIASAATAGCENGSSELANPQSYQSLRSSGSRA